MDNESRFWLWFWGIIGFTIVGIACTVAISSIYSPKETAEESCALWQNGSTPFCMGLLQKRQ